MYSNMKYYQNICNCLRVIQQDINRKLKSANCWQRTSLKGNFGVKVKILVFHPKIRARNPFYDNTKSLLQSSLLNDKATEIESFLQSIFFTPKK